MDSELTFFVNDLKNLVPICPFTGDANDNELQGLGNFLLSLSRAADVREEITKRCDLRAQVGPQDMDYPSSTEDEPQEVEEFVASAIA